MLGDQQQIGNSRFALLDLLRLFAALMVLGFHWLFRGHAAGMQVTDYPSAAWIAVYGYIGVDWFFMISGFVIAWTAQGRSASAFAIMRFARLYPGFLAIMTITFLMNVSYGWPLQSPDWKDWLANTTMFAPLFGRPFMDGAYWSIVVELVFYGWVFLVLATGLWNHRVTIAFLWLALSVANMTWLKSDAVRFLFITDFAPWFIVGIMMQDIWKRGVRLEVMVILVTAFLASCLTLAFQVPTMAQDYGVAPDMLLLFSLNLLGLLLIVAAINIEKVQTGLARCSMYAGTVSYPLYLFHQHAGYMLLDRFAPLFGNSIAFLLALTAVFGVAFSTAYLLEKPLRSLIIKVLFVLMNRVTNATRWQSYLPIK